MIKRIILILGLFPLPYVYIWFGVWLYKEWVETEDKILIGMGICIPIILFMFSTLIIRWCI